MSLDFNGSDNRVAASIFRPMRDGRPVRMETSAYTLFRMPATPNTSAAFRPARIVLRGCRKLSR